MLTIYILSGRVFGKDIYEIDCTNDLNHRRFFSDKTGYPESNLLHYSSHVDNIDIFSCRNMILKLLNNYKMKNGTNFYKIDLTEAKEHIEKIILNINYSYQCEMKRIEEEQNKKRIPCF